MFSEDDLLPIAALQHLVFCERQWGLMYLEGLWAENRLTVEGGILHERVHEAGAETRVGVRVARGLRLRSLRLGLIGVADAIEFLRWEIDPAARDGPDPSEPWARLPGLSGWWQPFPVEYKRGRPKPGLCDEVQLCAQALCLEEMLGVHLSDGAIYYGQPRRRLDVALGDELRAATEAAAVRLHELTVAGRTPPAAYEKKCRSCSLLDLCLPRTTGGKRSVSGYLQEVLTER